MLAGLVTVLLLGGSVAASAEPASTEDPLWLSPEMRAWVHLQVPAAGRPEVRLERLLDALLQPGALGLREQTLATVTAAEAFTSRHADCTGFAHLFVALARELQVPAFFLLFEDIETYQRGNHLRIASAHLAAGFGPQGRVRVYDFGGVNPGSSSHPHRRISDQTAAAVYRSNRGAQLLAAGSIAAAIQQLRQAVTLDPTLGHAWTNLGVALRRNNDPQGAEAAYRRAIALNPDSLPAWRNLALLLDSSLPPGRR